MIYITRRTKFNSAHRLFNPELSDDENRNIFGSCSNPNGHGHNYTLKVTIKGEICKKTGMVIDLKELKTIIYESIITKVDHKHLNLDVDFLSGIIPTAENMTIKFWDILKACLPEDKGELYEIKLYETDNNIVIYRGEYH